MGDGQQQDNEGWTPGVEGDPDGVLESWETDAFSMTAVEHPNLREHNSYHHAMTVLRETRPVVLATMIQAQLQAWLDFQLDARGYDRLDIGIIAMFDDQYEQPRMIMGDPQLATLFHQIWSMGLQMGDVQDAIRQARIATQVAITLEQDRLGRKVTDEEGMEIAKPIAHEMQDRVFRSLFGEQWDGES